MITLREALTALKDALRTEESWEDTFPDVADYGFPTRLAGICGNVAAYLEREGVNSFSEEADAVHDQLYDLNVKFLDAHGPQYPLSFASPVSTAYPVGGWREYDREVRDGTIWKNQRRLALLDFMLEHCQ